MMSNHEMLQPIFFEHSHGRGRINLRSMQEAQKAGRRLWNAPAALRLAFPAIGFLPAYAKQFSGLGRCEIKGEAQSAIFGRSHIR